MVFLPFWQESRAVIEGNTSFPSWLPKKKQKKAGLSWQRQGRAGRLYLRSRAMPCPPGAPYSPDSIRSPRCFLSGPASCLCGSHGRCPVLPVPGAVSPPEPGQEPGSAAAVGGVRGCGPGEPRIGLAGGLVSPASPPCSQGSSLSGFFFPLAFNFRGWGCCVPESFWGVSSPASPCCSGKCCQFLRAVSLPLLEVNHPQLLSECVLTGLHFLPNLQSFIIYIQQSILDEQSNTRMYTYLCIYC